MSLIKKPRNKNFRKRRQSSESEDETDETEVTGPKLEDIKELQKLRERPKGVNLVGLALGKKRTETEDADNHDPFKMKTGGIVDIKALKSSRTELTAEEKDAIGTAFAAETNRRDEDAEMLRYVEEELARRKGKKKDGDDKQRGQNKQNSLYELPESLKSVSSSTKRTEDMLSNQMLSGIPEIDLGIEAKIKNIEETEEAKQKLIQERMKKKDAISEFVPTNMAVNFVQHNRFNIEDTSPILKKKKQEPVPTKQVRVGGAEKKGRPLTVQPDEKATDDFHYEKFKKQMRRF